MFVSNNLHLWQEWKGLSYQQKVYKHLLQNLCVLGFENAQTNAAGYNVFLLRTLWHCFYSSSIVLGTASNIVYTSKGKVSTYRHN